MVDRFVKYWSIDGYGGGELMVDIMGIPLIDSGTMVRIFVDIIMTTNRFAYNMGI